MARYENRSFSNTELRLCGNEFVNCHIEGCKLIFDGTSATTLEDCAFENCDWEFHGPAANTLSFMAAMYHQGPAGRKLLEYTFDYIRGKKPEGPTVH